MKSSLFRRASVMAGIAGALVLSLIGVPVAQASTDNAAALPLAAMAISGEIAGVGGGLSSSVVGAHIAAAGAGGSATVVGGTTAFAAATAAEGAAGAVALAGTAGVTAATNACFTWCTTNTFDWLTNLNPFKAPLGDLNDHLPSTFAPTDVRSVTPYTNADRTAHPNMNFDAGVTLNPLTITNTPYGYAVDVYASPKPASGTSITVGMNTQAKCRTKVDLPASGQRPAMKAGDTWWNFPRVQSFFINSTGKNPLTFSGQDQCNTREGQPGVNYYIADSNVEVVGGRGDLPSISTSVIVPSNSFRWETGAGSQVAPAGVKYQVIQQCVAANGVVTELRGTESFGTSDGVDYPSCKASGKGLYSKLSELWYDNGVGTRTVIWSVYPDIPSDFADCDPSKNGGTLCKLEVRIDDQPCTMGNEQCSKWTSLAIANPDHVKCMWGGHSMAVSQCSKLEQAYNDFPSQRNDKNTDGNPDTGGPEYWVEPVRNMDGTQQQIPRPSSDPGTGQQPSTGTFPTYGSQPSYNECLSKTWTWNPIDWVAVPVSCSINEAFVPRADVQGRLQTEKVQLENKLQAKGIAPAVSSFGGVFDALGNAGGIQGCKGPHVGFALQGGVSFDAYPLDACAEPMKGFAAVGNAIASLGVIIFGGLAIIRAIGRGFGFEFGMGGK